MPDYDRISRLGSGNFGEVWLVYDHALNVRRAVKYVSPSRVHDPTNFYNEPRTLMELQHENIVRVEDAGRLPNGTLYIAMEYVPKGSVESSYRGKPIPLTIAFKILKGICWALEYAHNRNIIHRDIKPANILIASDGKAKLSDFGLAARIPQGAAASPCGYISHLAPEIITTDRASKLTDMYALGVTAYRIINGDGFLPDVNDNAEIKDLIAAGLYPDRNHYRPYVPTRIQRVVNRCIAVNPHARYQSPSKFRQALETICLLCDWRFQRIRRSLVYFTNIGQTRYRVKISQDRNRKFEIETEKQVRSNAPRRMTRDCEKGMALGKMKKKIRRILQRYVIKGK